jgi:diaminopimelate epimerase
MKEIPFTKMTGAGNDFIVIDNRQQLLTGDFSDFIRTGCERRRGVGADGMLLLENSDQPGLDFRMRYFNADGGEAEMCGNGGRCIALFAYQRQAAAAKMRFGTQAGVYQAEILDQGNRVRLGMVDPRDIRLQFDLELAHHAFTASFVNTGVPHVVVETSNVNDVQVVELGRQIRNHKQFAPAGTNANFVTIIDRSQVSVRTYERGVEDETLACGTGVTAVAVIMSLLGKVRLPVTAQTRGGDRLSVYGKVGNGTVTQVYLEGPAVIIYEGNFKLQ